MPFASKTIPVFVTNRTVRQNIYGQNIIFNGHRILKIAFACNKLVQLFYNVVCNFALCCFNRWINNRPAFFIVPRGNTTFAKGVDENTKSSFIHNEAYTPGQVWRDWQHILDFMKLRRSGNLQEHSDD
jgi:hypothetical protein